MTNSFGVSRCSTLNLEYGTMNGVDLKLRFKLQFEIYCCYLSKLSFMKFALSAFDFWIFEK